MYNELCFRMEHRKTCLKYLAYDYSIKHTRGSTLKMYRSWENIFDQNPNDSCRRIRRGALYTFEGLQFERRTSDINDIERASHQRLMSLIVTCIIDVPLPNGAHIEEERDPFGIRHGEITDQLNEIALFLLRTRL